MCLYPVMKNILILLMIFFSAHCAKVYGQKNVEVFTDFELFEKSIMHRSGDSVYVINFWATWCKPCVQELPYFDILQQKYRDSSLKVILVSLDDSRYVHERVVRFMESKKVESEVVLLAAPDANAWIDRVDTNWEGSIPATLFYKGNKRIFKEEEFEHFEDLEQIVKSFF